MVSDARLTILVTGAGAPGIRGTLYALRHNPDGRAVRIVGSDIDPDAVGRHFLDAFHTVPPPEDPTFTDAVLSVCTGEGVQVLLPQTTRELTVLAAARDALLKAGVSVAVSSAAAIDTANDKVRVLEASRAAGLPTARFRRAGDRRALEAAVAELGYPEQPVVVKPPTSSGMRGVRVLRAAAWDVDRFLGEKPSGLEMELPDLLAMLGRGAPWPPLLVMEYLPGEEFTVDAFRGEFAQIAVVRRRSRIRSGISFDTEVVSDPTLAERSLVLAAALDLRFAFGFQFRRAAHGELMVLESNPRVQGTMIASAFAGVNVIWMAVREATGAPVREAPTPGPARFLRFWGGVGIGSDRTDVI